MMLRGLFKTGVASTLHWTGADSLLARSRGTGRVPLVIGYHRVVEDYASAASYSIPPMLTSVRTFERQLDWLGRRYEFITLDELAQWAEGGRRFRRPVAAITFDDGYADLYRHAWPVLRRKGIPAAVFVVTGNVGTPDLLTHDELYLLLQDAYARWDNPRRALADLVQDLKLPVKTVNRIHDRGHDPMRAAWALIGTLPQDPMLRLLAALREEGEVCSYAAHHLRLMDWAMLGELSRGDIQIGSHTRTHVRLILEPWKKMLGELRGARNELEHRLGRPVQHFAYPSGAFNPGVVNAVAEAGYRCAYTSCSHRDSRHPALTIPRRLWWEHSGLDAFGRMSPSLMSCQVSGVFDFAASCGPTHGM
jgi:peptidoglycan/xylan/chitin deacetylase (PgdA/CDA1 family)